MSTGPALPVLREAMAARCAVLAFSVYNLEQAQAVALAAEASGCAAILQAGAAAFALHPARILGPLALTTSRASRARVTVHLDHSRSLVEIRECLEMGYASVMYDGSALPFDENVIRTRQAVDLARRYEAWVEGELGAVRGNENASAAASGAGDLTDPFEAERFVELTGVDALAVAVGNVHGVPPETVHLNLELIERISARVDTPLVLHGVSGLRPEEIRAAIEAGVAKLNVNADLRRAFLSALGTSVAATDSDDLVHHLGRARDACTALVQRMMSAYSQRDEKPEPT